MLLLLPAFISLQALALFYDVSQLAHAHSPTKHQEKQAKPSLASELINTCGEVEVQTTPTTSCSAKREREKERESIILLYHRHIDREKIKITKKRIMSNFQQRVGGGRRQPFGFLDDNTLVSSSSSSSSKSKSKRNSFASINSAITTEADRPSDAFFKLKKGREPTKDENVRHILFSSIVTRSQARGISMSTSSACRSSSATTLSVRSTDYDVEHPTKKKTTRLYLANDDDDCKRNSSADRIITIKSSTSAPTAVTDSAPTRLTESMKETVAHPFHLANKSSEFSPCFEDCASIFRQPMAEAHKEDDDANNFWGSGMEDMLTLKRANPIISKEGEENGCENDDSSSDEGWQNMVDNLKSFAEDLLLAGIAAEGRGEPIYYSSQLAEDDLCGFNSSHNK